MKRVAGFVELFTQKVPAVRAGHKKSTLTVTVGRGTHPDIMNIISIDRF